MRRPIIAGNWKMFKTLAETRAFFDALIPEILGVDHCEIVVAPPFTALATAAEEADGTRVSISAQDVFWEPQGAFTGEIAVKMLVDAGCGYVIIGHSERRQFFGETDETVEKKTRAAIGGELHAIVCVGETLAERDAGHAVGSGPAADTGRPREIFSIGTFPYHDCLRARVGDWHGPHGDAGNCRGDARRNPQNHSADSRSWSGCRHSHFVWRKRQAGQHRFPDAKGRHRWSSGRRSEPRCGIVCGDNPVQVSRPQSGLH